MKIEIRALKPAEFAQFCAIDRLMFDDPSDDSGDEVRRALFDLSRTHCAFIAGKMVATLATFSFDFAIPGGSLPMGATTCVAVLPTHRRMGLLRAMMRSHLDEVRERGEPMAALWASEGGIYGRFGFGIASEGQRLELDAHRLLWRDAPQAGYQVELLLDSERAIGDMRDVHARALVERPGLFGSSTEWWLHAKLRDDPAKRNGGSAHRYLVCTDPQGVADGYACYRQHSSPGTFGRGTIEIIELIANSAPAHAALWRLLTSIDLFPRVNYWNAPVDDALPWLVGDRYGVERAAVDGLWLRPLAVEKVLNARRYMADGELVLEVRDEYYPELGGRFALEVGNEVGHCERTTRNADVTLDIATLGSLYLGGQRVGPLAQAGLVAGDAEALRRVDALFGWPIAPWCSQVF